MKQSRTIICGSDEKDVKWSVAGYLFILLVGGGEGGSSFFLIVLYTFVDPIDFIIKKIKQSVLKASNWHRP